MGVRCGIRGETGVLRCDSEVKKFNYILFGRRRPLYLVLWVEAGSDHMPWT